MQSNSPQSAGPRRRYPALDEGAAAALISAAAMAVMAVVLALVRGPPPHIAATAAPPPPLVALSPERPPPAPATLQARLDQIAKAFGQPVGMAVVDVGAGWTAQVDGEGVYPQQSVSKLWVAISVLDAIDHHRFGLDDTVVMGEDDRSVFFQPLTARIGPSGLPITIRELLGHALSDSDNSANDRLMRQVGGPLAVTETLRRKGLRTLRVGAAERDLQAGTAGLVWKSDYGYGRRFQEARAKLTDAARDAALKTYLDDPPDGVKPVDIARALAALKRDEVLSADSTAVMLGMMAKARTGPMRLRGGLPRGWSIAHKTGTGPDWRGASVGINDVGLITAPDGHTYAVAVMIRRTSRSVPERLAMMQQVSQAIVAAWEAERELASAMPIRR